MSLRLQSPFPGTPLLHFSLNGRSNKINAFDDRRCRVRRAFLRKRICSEKKNDWLAQVEKFSRFCGKNVELLRKSLDSRSRMIEVKCLKEPFVRSRGFVVRSLAPVWEEGLFFLRCSVFFAVISGVCLLVWYGQNKARAFVETKLLPSVCSMVSETIQREVDFGKVRRVSPLSITLEACSAGTHCEEFSCGEVPTMKLCVRPFASLRRGKIVVDAILSNPTVLVAQKKDFTWLGIPFSETSLHSHLSSEEGIDFRTKTRRVSREEAGIRWDSERDNDARKAAEMGYIIPCKNPSQANDDALKQDRRFIEIANSKSFICMDENMHSADQRCMDTGIDYDVKHAELEKSFGIKIPGSGLKFLTKMLKGPRKYKFKWNSKSNGNSVSDISAKKRILERSAAAALSYFHSLSQEKSDELSLDMLLVKGETEISNQYDFHVPYGEQSLANDLDGDDYQGRGTRLVTVKKATTLDQFTVSRDPFLMTVDRLCALIQNEGSSYVTESETLSSQRGDISMNVVNQKADDVPYSNQSGNKPRDFTFKKHDNHSVANHSRPTGPWNIKLNEVVKKLTGGADPNVADNASHLSDGQEKLPATLPFMLDSVQFKSGTLMLLAYGDTEPREMRNIHGHVKFQNHYGRVYVQLGGKCNMWRSDVTSEDGGLLSVDVFVDTLEQNWHANLKVANFFVPIFERILEIPIEWSKGRATGEVHLCMSRGEIFPNLHGQLDVTGLGFHIYDAPSSFSDVSASLSFRGQRIFLHNASGWFGKVPLEASGDFGIHPDDGEFHLMCQVPYVEINALMKTFKMKPLFFPLAGSVTAVFNCQGPLDAPVFVGSCMVSRKIAYLPPDLPSSVAYEAMLKNKEAGAVAAFDRVPFSYLSANFTFNTDNCVADLYGIRATLVDGGEIRGAGNAWICPKGEVDDTALDVNFSGNASFDKVLHRYVPEYLNPGPLKLGDLTGETKLSGALLKPRFDIKWAAPKADGSLTDARGDIVISHDNIIVNSSSVAFDLHTKLDTSYKDQCLSHEDFTQGEAMPFVVEGLDLDLRMRNFECFSLVSSYPFDSPRPTHLKATGRIKFLGKIKRDSTTKEGDVESDSRKDAAAISSLVGEISISSLKLNQLILAPQLAGRLSVSRDHVKLDAVGRPDESLTLDFVGPLQPNSEENVQSGKLLSFSLQKGQLRANACYQPQQSATLEIRNFPLDELELASLRGVIQRAEIQLNLQKRRGHGLLSVIRPKFSGVLGEALDVAVRWSGDVITVEKTILEQSNSRYELQGEYVLPGSRDRDLGQKEAGSFLMRAMTGHLGSVISSMGRWRMRLEVPKAEVAEMLPLARLLSRSTDPAVHSRSKDLFIQSVQNLCLQADNLRDLLEEVRGYYTPESEVVLEDLSLPGLAELKGHWNGSLDASGGGNGDTLAEFDFHGDDWEWGTYKTQRVLATGSYSNDDGLRLKEMLIQKGNATLHADGTLLGPKTNLHFAVLNFPVSLIPTLVEVVESSASDLVHSLRQLLSPIKGILHMEGDLRGSLEKPECDVQVRLLDGAVGGIDLGRAEGFASLTSNSRFLFNSNFEPFVQNGHVHIQGSVPVSFSQKNTSDGEDREADRSGAVKIPSWVKEKEDDEKRTSRDRSEEGWDSQLAESLKGLNWNILDAGEVRLEADIKDGGMTLLTAISPYANWLQGNADIRLQVGGTVENPVLDGSASFHRASISSPVLRKPLTNFGGTLHVKSNRLCITSLESRVSRRGKLVVKGNLPLRSNEASSSDRIELKCEVLEVRAKNFLSGQVDTQLQISGSMLQPTISGNIKLSHGEAYLPHDKGGGAAPFNRLAANQSRIGGASFNQAVASRYFARFFGTEPASSRMKFSQSAGESNAAEKEIEELKMKPNMDIRLSNLKLVLGPELRIVYPLILNFAISGELELDGMAHPKYIKPKGILTFENGDVNLVATQVRLKREHLNVAKFEPEHGLDPLLDLALVGSEWQFRIQSRASNWQDKLVVTSTRSVEQDALSPSEAAKVFESQLAESILEGDGQLAFKKLATATLESLMPKIEGKGEFGQARWRLVYAPQIPSLLSVDPTIDPLKSLASNISLGTEVEVQLGKRLQASVVRQMKDSEMAMQWTLIYQLTSRLRVLLQSAPSKRLLFEYSATSQD
uniref:Translocation and assembly module TamB C-terminal domain-containing protein n=1 Tax=Noccaea caerulescens TaxID=107243 RepID=A0A1J3ED73_NOCCA